MEAVTVVINDLLGKLSDELKQTHSAVCWVTHIKILKLNMHLNQIALFSFFFLKIQEGTIYIQYIESKKLFYS